MTETLKEAKRLYDLGLAIIWLHPRSKRPVASGWTTGPRTDWEKLSTTYKEGFNVGVRTGEASKIGDYYLACFDLDVKDSKYEEAANAKIREVLPDSARFWPFVLSGRRLGSLHLYCLSKEPFKMITIAKEKGWELCAYSSGRQMVLPPSIHPDTGNKYEWGIQIGEDNLELFDFSSLGSITVDRSTSKKRDVIDQSLSEADLDHDFDIAWAPEVNEQLRKLIVKGEWQGRPPRDRSSKLPLAIKGLLNCGLTEKTILTVLTDPNTFLGSAAMDRRGGNRKSAIAWLKRDFDKFYAQWIEEKKSGDGEKKKTAEARIHELFETFEREHPYKTMADEKVVYTFDGVRYKDISPIELRSFAEAHLNPKPNERMRNEFLHKIMANNVLRRNFFTDTTEGKLNFKNGILDLSEKAELIAHSPDYGFRAVLPYDFDPEARCPVFDHWIYDIMLGDRELVYILQEYMGYIIRGGEYKYHKALWLDGVGRNGKSTFLDVLKALIGFENYANVSIKALIGDKFMSAMLDGKLANFSDETSSHELNDSGPFKNLTGDGDVSAQKKFGDPYAFRNKAKLVMSYNQMPDLKELSAGMMSRPLIVPFRKLIGEDEQDRDIKKKLFKELPGIFNFALKGWYRLEAQEGFTKSKSSKVALDNIEKESCNVYQWVEDHVELDFNGHANKYDAGQLYAKYKKDEHWAFKRSEFFRRLKKHPTMKAAWGEERKNGRVFYDGIVLK